MKLKTIVVLLALSTSAVVHADEICVAGLKAAIADTATTEVITDQDLSGLCDLFHEMGVEHHGQTIDSAMLKSQVVNYVTEGAGKDAQPKFIDAMANVLVSQTVRATK